MPGRCLKTFTHDVLAQVRRDRRRYIHPGNVVLYVLVVVFFSLGFAKVQGVQRDFRDNALQGCQRQNTQSQILLDLRTIITEARNLTSTSKRVRNAAPRFLARVKRMRPSLTTYALRDLAIIVGGDSGEPKSPELIAAAEDDFIEKAKKIERPRDCKKLYG